MLIMTADGAKFSCSRVCLYALQAKLQIILHCRPSPQKTPYPGNSHHLGLSENDQFNKKMKKVCSFPSFFLFCCSLATLINKGYTLLKC